MSLAAKQEEYLEKNSTRTTYVSPGERTQSGDPEPRQIFEKIAEGSTNLADRTKESARRAYDQLRIRASKGYSRVVETAQDLGRSTQNRTREMRQQRPLQLIAMIAGAAFIAGIAIRIWRSRS